MRQLLRSLAIVAVVMLVVVVATGCSRKSTPTAPPPPPPPTPSVPQPPTQPPVQPEQPVYMTIAQLLEALEQGQSVNKVVLAGLVVAQAEGDDENYLLRDATGQVRVEREEEDLPIGENIRMLGDPESRGCDVFPGVGEVCTTEVAVLAWERIQ